MKHGWRYIMAGFLLAGAMATRAAPCGDIVQATLDEMRAGMGSRWTADTAAIVRAAAGAACVKTRSGRYAEMAADAVDTDRGEERADATPDSDEAGGLWPFSGAGVKSITGSPAKKPYERRRGD